MREELLMPTGDPRDHVPGEVFTSPAAPAEATSVISEIVIVFGKSDDEIVALDAVNAQSYTDGWAESVGEQYGHTSIRSVRVLLSSERIAEHFMPRPAIGGCVRSPEGKSK
jgi:hypothetical protein